MSEGLSKAEPSQPRPFAVGAPHRVPTDAEIAELAGEVGVLIRQSALRCAFEVGRLITERLMGGDSATWHRRGPKPQTLVRLVDRLESVGITSAASVYECLSVYEVLAPLGVVVTSQQLTPSHVRAVLPLAPEARGAVLLRAEAEGWSVRDTRAKVHSMRPRRRGGRAPTTRVEQAIRRAAALFAALDDRDLGDAALLSAERLSDLKALLVEMRERADAIEVRLSPKRRRASLGEADAG